VSRPHPGFPQQGKRVLRAGFVSSLTSGKGMGGDRSKEDAGREGKQGKSYLLEKSANLPYTLVTRLWSKGRNRVGMPEGPKEQLDSFA
jgi:hypothetical protein